jgi:hypothetical protein
MIAAARPLHSNPDADSVQGRFLALLPKIRVHARIHFRHVCCPHEKEEAIAETVALAWESYVRLADRGKDATEFVSALASFAAQAVGNGRQLCKVPKPNDALSPLAQRRHGFTVSPLPSSSSLGGNVFDEALEDNMQTPVIDQVIFRCDFPAWHRTRTDRDRRLIDDLMVGERTNEVARRYGLTPARVSQLRREFCADWQRFSDEKVDVSEPVLVRRTPNCVDDSKTCAVSSACIPPRARFESPSHAQ